MPQVYILIFLAVLALVFAAWLLVFGGALRRDRRTSARLELLADGGRAEVLERLRKERAEIPRSPTLGTIAAKAQRANIQLRPQTLAAIMAGIALVIFAAMSVATQTGLALRLIVSAGVGVGAVYGWLAHRASARIRQAEEQLPDTVELIVRALRVGHPFISAVQTVAREVPAPLGLEFATVADEAAYGRNIADSLRDMAERLDMQDMRFLAVAVSIQQTSGGNLAEVLEGLAKVIRARFRLFRRISAITAEPRWSGIFLSAFPLVVLALILIFAPDFYDDVKDKPSFIPMALLVFALLGANMLFMKIMTTIRV